MHIDTQKGRQKEPSNRLTRISRHLQRNCANSRRAIFLYFGIQELLLILGALILLENVVTAAMDKSILKNRRSTTRLSNELAEQSRPIEESTIRLTRFQVPEQVRAGDFRRLSCHYELQQATLHAMKLFKDNKEFYRYTPSDQKQAFPMLGIQVDLKRSNHRDIWLKINRQSSGQYKCQVQVEGTFNSVSAEKRMEVVSQQQAPSGNSNGANTSSTNSESSVWPYAGASARPRTTQMSRNQSGSNRHQKPDHQQPSAPSTVQRTQSTFYGFHTQSGAGSMHSPQLIKYFIEVSLVLLASVQLKSAFSLPLFQAGIS